MSNDQERNFNVLAGRQNQICSFFLRGICSNGKACKFRHTQNVDVEISPQQQIINEIDIAVNRRNLSQIFQKMLLNKNNEYKKYYNEIHMKFRGYSVMKLRRQSVVDMFLGHEDKRNHTFDQSIFKYRNLKLDDTILPYGFIPFLFHFFIMGFAWNTFQGAKDIQEQSDIDECYIEFTAQLQKRYTNTEYDDIVRDACEFVDPDTKENMIMVSSHYLCDRVVVDIKEVFKNIKRRQYTLEELSEERIEVGEEKFKELLLEARIEVNKLKIFEDKNLKKASLDKNENRVVKKKRRHHRSKKIPPVKVKSAKIGGFIHNPPYHSILKEEIVSYGKS
jgi:hypothetical protein